MGYMVGQLWVALIGSWVLIGVIWMGTRGLREDNRVLRSENADLRGQVDRLLTQMSLSQGIPGYRNRVYHPPTDPDELVPSAGYFDKKPRY